MRREPLLDGAELVHDRVRPFVGTRPYVATGDLDDEGRLSPTPVTFAGRPSRADLRIRAGDVCMARMRNTAKVRRFDKGEEDLILSTGFAVLRPRAHIDGRYLRHWLRSEEFQRSKDRLCSGAVQPAITNQGLTELKMPVPSLDEQRRIADVLDNAELLEAKRSEVARNLDALPQAIYLEMFGHPVSNPQRLPTARLAELGRLDRGVSKHRPRNDPRLLGGSTPLIQTGDVANAGGYITKFESTYSEFGLAQSKLWPAGTLCITIAANIGRTAILTFPACFPDSVVGFTTEIPGAVEFVRVFVRLLQPVLEELAPESAQKNINLKVLRALEVPVPSYSRINEFASRVGNINCVMRTTGVQEAALERFAASLQQRAFAGEL